MPELKMARMLIERAEEDVAVLRLLLKAKPTPLASAGFHAQQAVEKALKAWLVLLDVDYPLTHSLYALIEIAEKTGADCARYEMLSGLSPYAAELRYGMSETGAQVDTAAVRPAIVGLVAQVRGLVEAAEAEKQ